MWFRVAAKFFSITERLSRGVIMLRKWNPHRFPLIKGTRSHSVELSSQPYEAQLTERSELIVSDSRNLIHDHKPDAFYFRIRGRPNKRLCNQIAFSFCKSLQSAVSDLRKRISGKSHECAISMAVSLLKRSVQNSALL